MPSLGNDLAALRKEQDLSIEDVQKRTRIPLHILESIEDDSIFTQIDEYTTYTRSYVRSYAKAIGIGEEAIVRALDQVEEGHYDGHLAGGPAEPPAADDTDATEEAGNGDESSTDGEGEASTGAAEAGEGDVKSSRPPKKEHTSPPIATAPKDWDWVRVGRQAKAAPSRSPAKTGLLIIIILVALIAGGFWAYSYYYAAETPPADTEPRGGEVEQPATPPDSLQETLVGNEDESRPEVDTTVQSGPEGLADTLSIAIYAANGKLEPVRIYTDILGQRNPYWVPQGDTIRFNFVNTVRIRAVNQYDRMQLLFNGHIIQNYYQQYFNEASGMVELDRSVFENHPEWHRPPEQPSSS